jgi:hypothetical protein
VQGIFRFDERTLEIKAKKVNKKKEKRDLQRFFPEKPFHLTIFAVQYLSLSSVCATFHADFRRRGWASGTGPARPHLSFYFRI